MDEIFVECTYDDDCTFIKRSYVPIVALGAFDDHLQEAHDTDFETEIKRLEEEGRSLEAIVREQVDEQPS